MVRLINLSECVKISDFPRIVFLLNTGNQEVGVGLPQDHIYIYTGYRLRSLEPEVIPTVNQ